MNIVAPQFNERKFTCPTCGAYSQMSWQNLFMRQAAGFAVTGVALSICGSCDAEAIWKRNTGPKSNDPALQALANVASTANMVYPPTVSAPNANTDLPASCVQDFEEARQIARVSPRAAAGLLRLCIQKICKELGEPGKDINQDIKALVAKGLPVQVQQALDTVRVVGNEAVHPGTISNEDHATQVNSLFTLVNIIVQQMISQPKAVREMYEKLPPAKLEGIEIRDRQRN